MPKPVYKRSCLCLQIVMGKLNAASHAREREREHVTDMKLVNPDLVND